jgi:hypothetical protein
MRLAWGVIHPDPQQKGTVRPSTVRNPHCTHNRLNTQHLEQPPVIRSAHADAELEIFRTHRTNTILDRILASYRDRRQDGVRHV